MKSYHLHGFDGLGSLTLRDAPGRPLAAREVRVRMAAASLNYRDLLILMGHLPGHAVDGVVPLSDGAGEIIEVGPAVSHLSPGDKVIALFNPSWIDGPPAPGYFDRLLGGNQDGTLAQEAIFLAEGVVPMPAYLSFTQAAAFGCASITAWASLVGGRPLTAGETVLVQGTGGVSLFALQFAKIMGARVIATTSTPQKAERLRALGADAVIDYVANPEWQDAARALTAGEGVDRVVEVGGPGTFQRSIAALRIGGHIAAVGYSGGIEGKIDPLSLIGTGITIEGIATGSRRHLSDQLRLAAHHEVRPVIDSVYPFDRAANAYAHLQARGHFGKVVITID